MPLITLNIQNPDAEIKKICLDCSYLNPKATGTYKCHAKGSCPAISVEKVNKHGLSTKSNNLIEAFDKAAQKYGWELDQGSTSSSIKAKKLYTVAKDALSRHVLELEDMAVAIEAQNNNR